MPYITSDERQIVDGPLCRICELLGMFINSEGVLNYSITRLVQAFLGKSPSYADFNAVIGVLECAKLELYRRAVAPYEDQKREENGDVY
jgi:hypothetical protein